MPVDVSVIIPNYNHANYLEERITSVLNQDYSSFEVILLDDYSTDNSREILEKFSHHTKVSHFIVNDNNSGSTFKQWQKGVSLAQGKYIWIAESDDVAEASFLSHLMEICRATPHAVMAYCQSSEIDTKSVVIGDYFRYTNDLEPNIWHDSFTWRGDDFVLSYLTKRNCLPNVSAILFKRTAFESLDNDVTSCRYLGDWLFYVKVLANNSIAYTPRKLNQFRTHSMTTRSGKTLEQWTEIKSEFFKVYNEIKGNFNWHDSSYLHACQQTDVLVDKLTSIIPAIEKGIEKGQINGDIAVYGAGALGVFVCNLIERCFDKSYLRITCFIDKKAESSSQPLELFGKKVVSIDDYEKSQVYSPIFIASIAFYHDITEQLSHKGLEHLLIDG